MNKSKKFFGFLDELLYKILKNNVNNMPIRYIKLIAYYFPDARIRKDYFDKLGVYMGRNSYANLGMKIVIGEKEEEYMVLIGENVSIGPNLTLVVDSFPNNSKDLKNIPYVRDKLCKNERIIIEDEVWIGANVTILPGVHIGKCSVIGAGSLVNKEVDAYSIYAGTPARKIRKLNMREE